MNNLKDEDKEYEEASAGLSYVRDRLPAYKSSYDQPLQELFREITERPAFTYDPNDDALYQSYKQSYAQQGHLAMEDSMGYAAGLTGGYGSSYAQSVGQQQYDAYLQKLSDIYPELYAMAYSRYQDEGAALQKEYDMLKAQEDDAYQKYLDLLDAQYRADNIAYERGADAYDRLVDMMLTMGYVPTAEELQAAGMSSAHMEAYLNYYKSQNAVPTGGGGKGNGGKKTEKNEDVYDSLMQDARERLAKGESAESINADIAKKAASGELDAETARALVTAVTKAQFG